MTIELLTAGALATPENHMASGSCRHHRTCCEAHRDLNIIATLADQMVMDAQKVLADNGKLKTIQLTGDGGRTNASQVILQGVLAGHCRPQPAPDRTGPDTTARRADRAGA